MPITFDVKKDFEVKKGTPDETLEPSAPSSTISINGKTISNVEELPPWLRGVLLGLADIAAKGAASGESSALSDDVSASQAGAVRPEPLVGAKAVVILVVLAAIVFWLVRSVI